MEEKGDKMKNAALIMGVIMYFGGVIAFTVLTMSFFTGWMDEPQDLGDYVMLAAMQGSVILIAFNAIAMPMAIHSWTLTGFHRALGFIFYGLDLTMLAINIIAAWSTLNGNPPAWVVMYDNYSVIMFITPLVSWGIMWIFDPVEKGQLMRRKASQEAEIKIAQFELEYYQKSTEAEDEFRNIAAEQARQKIKKLSEKGKKTSFFGESKPAAIPANAQNTAGLFQATSAAPVPPAVTETDRPN